MVAKQRLWANKGVSNSYSVTYTHPKTSIRLNAMSVYTKLNLDTSSVVLGT